jgi:Secretion system C-terminal sorting domain
MKLLYPSPKENVFNSSFFKTVLTVLLFTTTFSFTTKAQSTTAPELVFKNASLVFGTDGSDNAVYRFPAVGSGVDALVKINGRSSSLVKLVSIDLTNTGFAKAFQPQVTYNNNTAPGPAEWWMEFQVSFVQSGSNTPVAVNNFDLTALDIDGNGDKINENVCLYNLKSYVLESNSDLTVSNMMETVLGVLTNTGKRFDGPVTNYVDIDTSATNVMTTNTYQNVNSFRIRTGATSTGVSGAADRMYSFWFKGFTYDEPVQSFLPVTLINWNATYVNNNVSLKWSTTVEKNASHFIIERSVDGVEYTDAAMIFANGNSDIVTNYAFTDKIPAGNSGVIYYRLKMVDMDGRSQTSVVRLVRIGKTVETVKILAYPNPVVNEVRITIPQNWQDNSVTYQVINTNGQTVKSFTIQHANQTEVISMAQVPAGMYIMKVTKGNEISTQAIVKSTN